MPVRWVTSPLPPSVHRPARKSVPASGSGSGFHRRRFGSGTAWVKGAVRTAPLPVRVKAGWAADGRTRTATSGGCAPRLGERRAAQLLRVQAQRGPLRRVPALGQRPGTASELCSLPKPDR